MCLFSCPSFRMRLCKGEMLRGRDFEHALNKALDYGGKAATAYQVGKAAYTAGRFILPLIL